MFAKLSLVFALFAASAQVAYAVPPSCLLDAINTQSNSADLKSICITNAAAVKSAITDKCGSSAQDALTAYKKVCGDTSSDGSNSTSTSSSGSGTASATSASSKATIVYTTTSFDTACSCTKTAVKTTVGAVGPSGFPSVGAGSNSTAPTAPAQPSSPANPSGGSGSPTSTSAGGAAVSTGAASALEIGGFGITAAVVAIGAALAL
ncbi:MAG: hypothetical protein M1820_008407 [Bogoriella megaspora]|nr:MAG: hypothetical protein M1820_008407 [Bogoriella megaspora]